jgi:hypothetical protein
MKTRRAKNKKRSLDLDTYPEDWRKEKPGLHMLYTKTAVKHLTEMDRAIKAFDGFSNLNMLGVTMALIKERERLVNNNAAYAEAQEILSSIHATRQVT